MEIVYMKTKNIYLCIIITPMVKIDEAVKTKFRNNKHRFIANLVYTANWFQNRVVEYLKPYGISFQQFNILRILKGAGDWVSMNDIKALMIEKSPNTTRLADKLLDKGVVDRRRSNEDRRVVYLMITEKGLDLLKTIDDNPGDYLDFMQKINEEEASVMSSILDKIRS